MFASKRKLIAALGIMASYGVLPLQPARADVIRTFDITGFFQNPSIRTISFPLSATVTIDTTTGTVTSQTIINPCDPLSGRLDPDYFLYQRYDATAQAYMLGVFADPLLGDVIYFNTPSLVGYAGGDLASLNTPTPGGAVSYTVAVLVGGSQLVYGQAVPEAVPEPSSGAVVAIGIAAVTLTIRRRRASQFGA